MASIQEKTTGNLTKDTPVTKESDPNFKDLRSKDSRSTIDPTAPAGSENSLGAESVRDGRPATDDSTVEAMDEESPDITAP